MGIDACLLVRYRGEKPTDDQIDKWSDALVALFGDGVDDANGLPLREYREAARAWTQRWKENAETAGPSPVRRLRAIDLTEDFYEDGGWERGTVYLQDGPDMKAQPGEWFLEVHVWTRYYNEGYERGNIVLICGLCDWVEENIPNSEVWYGGDSSGVLMEPFPRAKRQALLRYKEERDRE